MKVQLILALTVAALSTGCVIDPLYPYAGGVEIYEPSTIIVENGVRHDRFFYQRHPEIYRRDQLRYSDRFRHIRHDRPRHIDVSRRIDAPRHVDVYRRIDATRHVDAYRRVDAPRHVEVSRRVDAPRHVDVSRRVDAPLNVTIAPTRGDRYLGNGPRPGEPKQETHRRGEKSKKKHHDDDKNR